MSMKLIQLGIVFLSMAMFYGCTDELDKTSILDPSNLMASALR